MASFRTIVFVVHPITGSVNASMRLANDLRSAGHRVVYLGLADSRDYVTGNGFEFFPVFEAWFPQAYERSDGIDGEASIWTRLKAARKLVRRVDGLLHALTSGEERGFFQLMEALQPDLMVFVNSQETVSILALLAHSMGIKGIYLCDTLGRSRHSSVPPVTCGIIPGNGWYSEMRIFLAWRKLLMFRHIEMRLLTFLGLGIDWIRTSRRLARQCGYPWEWVDLRADHSFFDLRLPKIVPCPLEFEFPGAATPDRHYIDASIEFTRKQAEFPWHRLDSEKPIIYCALGTVAYLSEREYQGFFKAAITAAGKTGHWQWVLATGARLNPYEYSGMPGNAIVVDTAPQLDLLRRTAVMVNHGGQNTIKECLYFGVPMVVYPIAFDGPGNAARVRYHGLGVTGKVADISAENLLALISEVIETPGFLSRARAMRGHFLERERQQAGLKLIAAMLEPDRDVAAAA